MPGPSWSLLIGAAVFCVACDPGYQLRPVGWVPQGYDWSRDFGEFSIRTGPLSGFIGEWWIAPTFEIYGNSDAVTLKAASLHTVRGDYPAVISPHFAGAPPGGGRLAVTWHFDPEHRAPDILGRSAKITLDLAVGAAPRTVQIDYERVY